MYADKSAQIGLVAKKTSFSESGPVMMNEEVPHRVEEKPDSYFDRKMFNPSFNVADDASSMSASSTKKGQPSPVVL